MSPLADHAAWVRRHPSATYTAPFIVLLILLAVTGWMPFNPFWEAPLWALILSAALWACWPRNLSFALTDATGSSLLGVAVFLIWIAPDVIDPAYRMSPLFHNGIIGHIHSSLTPQATRSAWVIFWRSSRAILLVPLAEELFWRGWLMRWLDSPRFTEVNVGSYSPGAFWIVAILFGLEHGPYWDVGLLAGVLYNWWLIRTRCLADCIWAHAVTNACLSVYVIGAGAWQYWQ